MDAAATSTLARAPASAPMATTRASKTVVDDDAATDLTKGAIVAPGDDARRGARRAGGAEDETKTRFHGGAHGWRKETRGNGRRVRGVGVDGRAHVGDIRRVGADAAPGAAADETKETAGASAPVEEKAARVEEETIELPGGIVVPAPLRKVNKDLPFVFPTNDDDYGRGVKGGRGCRRARRARGETSRTHAWVRRQRQ